MWHSNWLRQNTLSQFCDIRPRFLLLTTLLSSLLLCRAPVLIVSFQIVSLISANTYTIFIASDLDHILQIWIYGQYYISDHTYAPILKKHFYSFFYHFLQFSILQHAASGNLQNFKTNTTLYTEHGTVSKAEILPVSLAYLALLPVTDSLIHVRKVLQSLEYFISDKNCFFPEFLYRGTAWCCQ